MSAVKNLTPLGIKEENLTLLRNDHINFDCGPLVYRTIIDWGFDLPEGKKIIDHINDQNLVDKIKEKCNVDLQKWMKKNESKLNKDSFSDFDITALYEFLPILCYDKIAQTGSKEYEKQTKDPNTVESLLEEIKAFRNNVSHEFSEGARGSHIDEMVVTMRECIRVTGKLYDKDQTEIDEKVKLLDDEFEKPLLDITHFYENRVKYIAQKIASEAPSNMLERYSPHFSVPLPGICPRKDTSDNFQCCNLSVTTEDKEVKTKYNKNVFPCTEIYSNKNEKFVVINGGPSTGKTTLMRNMCQDILETSVNGSTPKYEKIDQFKIPIYLECWYEQQTNLAKFLRECLNDFLSPEDDIYQAFKFVKGLVFLIDGYDQINSNCRQLVNSIIDFCRDNNASCIVSSQADAGNNFASQLQRKKLNYTIMFIEPISEMSDKVNFLVVYANKMDDYINTDKLVNCFEKLTAVAQAVFSSPILLALFISLFVHDPNSVSQMKTEHSAHEAVQNNFLREMAKKLKLENVYNPMGRALDVAKVLGKFCLKFFKAKKFHVDQKDYLKMVAECEKIKRMPAGVDIPNLLSCIFMQEHSLKFTQDTSYQFMHSTVQEVLAAKYVSENIKELQEDRKSHSQSEDGQLPKLLQVLQLDESQSDIRREMKRYGNIIKLLMLETLSKEGLSKYRSTFTLLLEKYYKPKYDWFGHIPSVYHLDLILSSNSNADIINIVSDCMRGWGRYYLKYNRHIKPMTEVVKKMEEGVNIWFNSNEVTNTQQIIKLLSVLGDNSEIMLDLLHSYDNYEPLEEKFYTQLKNSKCKVTDFTACIASKEHLSIVVRVLKGYTLSMTTPSVTDISFAALEEYEGDYLHLRFKYIEDFPSTGSNPVISEGTYLWIEHIPADGKENLYNLLKYILPKSKQFGSIHFRYCHLTNTDANELLKKLHGEKIRTKWGERTEVEEECVYQDKSRWLKLYLKEEEGSEEVEIEEEEIGENKNKEDEREEEREEEKRKEEEKEREKQEREEEEEETEEVQTEEEEKEEVETEEGKSAEVEIEEEEKEEVEIEEKETEELEIAEEDTEEVEIEEKETEDVEIEEEEREEVEIEEEESEEVEIEEEEKEEVEIEEKETEEVEIEEVEIEEEEREEVEIEEEESEEVEIEKKETEEVDTEEEKSAEVEIEEKETEEVEIEEEETEEVEIEKEETEEVEIEEEETEDVEIEEEEREKVEIEEEESKKVQIEEEEKEEVEIEEKETEEVEIEEKETEEVEIEEEESEEVEIEEKETEDVEIEEEEREKVAIEEEESKKVQIEEEEKEEVEIEEKETEEVEIEEKETEEVEIEEEESEEVEIEEEETEEVEIEEEETEEVEIEEKETEEVEIEEKETEEVEIEEEETEEVEIEEKETEEVEIEEKETEEVEIEEEETEEVEIEEEESEEVEIEEEEREEVEIEEEESEEVQIEEEEKEEVEIEEKESEE